MTLFKWFWAVVCIHGWWRIHPKEWTRIKQGKDKLTQKFVHFERLVDRNAALGQPIHSMKCKICGKQRYTTCKVDLCQNIVCWFKYYGSRN
jgi:hypothetical protein